MCTILVETGIFNNILSLSPGWRSFVLPFLLSQTGTPKGILFSKNGKPKGSLFSESRFVKVPRLKNNGD